MAPASAAASAATKVVAAVTKKGGLTTPLQVSPALKKLLGVGEVSRAGAMKGLWVYIKDHNLQNPENKKEVICDEKLKPVLGGKEKVGFLEIPKLLSENFPKSQKSAAASKSS